MMRFLNGFSMVNSLETVCSFSLLQAERKVMFVNVFVQRRISLVLTLSFGLVKGDHSVGKVFLLNISIISLVNELDEPFVRYELVKDSRQLLNLLHSTLFARTKLKKQMIPQTYVPITTNSNP